MNTVDISFTLNGVELRRAVQPEQLAADFLRDDLLLTGTKIGCGVGVCGLCTILVDDEPLSGCLLLAVQLDGRRVRTVEGLAEGENLSPLQQAFIEQGGFQCGICTPGQLMAATALLEYDPHPTEATTREWMKGNLCRCTGYYGILRAIEAASLDR